MHQYVHAQLVDKIWKSEQGSVPKVGLELQQMTQGKPQPTAAQNQAATSEDSVLHAWSTALCWNHNFKMINL